ncbi:MAG: hypothetical protein LBN30_03345 [Oscillospiraceae bacterium]|jgi:uncharacterized phage-like protein YoqJ|nr:hypothetical protein [Oscillospiraceae bacterium]
MARICTFFGHRTVPDELRPRLRVEIERHIHEHNTTVFYVGNNGAFDRMAVGVLQKLKPLYPQIRVFTILAYMPSVRDEKSVTEYDTTIYPEGLELVPKRFAIARRNRWMAEQSAFVIAYVRTDYGGAYDAVRFAERRGKSVTNLAD